MCAAKVVKVVIIMPTKGPGGREEEEVLFRSGNASCISSREPSYPPISRIQDTNPRCQSLQ